MNLSDFDFDLPENHIALRPARPRDAARLLVVRGDGSLEDRVVSDLPALLAPGDALVVNDTRVIPAALHGVRPARAEGGGGAAAIEVNLHARDAPDVWRAFARPGKRLRVGDEVSFSHGLSARVTGKGEGGEVTLAFNRSGAELDTSVAEAGVTPLPPYIAKARAPDAEDVTDYQTIYARADGSVAAPTAGLHFTDRLFDALDHNGVARETVTLHVGAGTFLPVKAERLADHVMHAEWCALDAATAARLNDVRAKGGRIVPVGTTSLRTLESAADAEGRLTPFAGETDIFIRPGYRFRAADALVTNFHLPRSTLFMLVCAFSGTDVMKRAYAHAVAEGYRFYSYGDACLLFPYGR